ncbi:MAG: bifunctional diaminohydroxyphosphoribosylaminopyrimidine deaminase/5-amino-6-(5-phosphoribosylamino)uracil reductase RibD [Bacteroidota bacterium]
MNSDEIYIKRCLQLAENGLGNVAPNPMVGAVIVCNGIIIGEGFHQKFGQAHAEVNAINNVENKELLKQSTIYVNLEPCAHYGKTPPCAELIVKMGIPNIVIGMIDPNEKVAGKGIEILKKAGCNVKVGVLENECKELNKRFITNQTKKRPYIILKWAQTKDGFIDIIRIPCENNRPTWITGENLRTIVHKWRTEEQGILVGANTVIFDNPMLTSRNWEGSNPTRILIDPELKSPLNSSIFDNSAPTYIFNSLKTDDNDSNSFIKIDFSENAINQILSHLFNKGISSVIIEGGRETLCSFIRSEIWDEARILTGNKFFNEGIKAPEIKGITKATTALGTDSITLLYNPKNQI